MKHKIKELRIELGLTQEEFAQRINSNQRQVSKWENDIIEPNIENIKKLADFFGVTTDYLLDKENDYGIIEVRNSNTPKENEVLNLFNSLDEAHQIMMLDIMKKFVGTKQTV